MAQTRERHRIYMRERRARERAAVAAANQPQPPLALAPPAPDDGEPVDLTSRRPSLPGSVAAAVRAELDAMPTAAAARPGLAAAAVTLGHLLDDPSATPQHPPAAARLADLLTQIRTAGKDAAQRPTSSLARLRSMQQHS